MSLSVGIVGLPNVGKSTLFNALLKKQQALAANYPFATIEPNVGVVPVPDERLEQLAVAVASGKGHEPQSITVGGKEGQPVLINPDKHNEELKYEKLPPLVPATVEFLDIAGLVAGAHKGEGLGNKFLAHIREVDAICFVVRAFSDGDVVQTGSGDFGEDLETVKMELVMADMETIDKQREPRGNADKQELLRWKAIEKVRTALEAGHMAAEAGLNDDEEELVRDLHLLTKKPAIYVVNVGEDQIGRGPSTVLNQADSRSTQDDALDLHSLSSASSEYAERLGVDGGQVVVISAKMEEELAALNEAEQEEYLGSVGLEKSGLERLIQSAYATLGLISFLTAGEKEVRAWTIPAGATAVQAAGTIHTDFAKAFIKADVIHWKEFVRVGGWKKAREEGLVRQEGRDYVMKEGDVVEFKVGA